jgi:rhodanese-related sulfurtransferase
MKISKKNLYLGVILLIAVLFNYVLANPVAKIDPATASKMLGDNSAIVVDVRELNEQQTGRIKNALSLPMSIMDTDKPNFEKIIASYDKNKTIILYCHSGRRAGLVGAELEQRGFKVLNLGGFEAWRTAGLPTE